MNLSRRSLLTSLIAAPAVIRLPGLLMPVRSWHDGIPGEIRLVIERSTVDKGYYPLVGVISNGRGWLPFPSNGVIQDMSA